MGKKFTETEFNRIKTLLAEPGVTMLSVSKKVGWSYQLVWHCSKVDTFDEYLKRSLYYSRRAYHKSINYTPAQDGEEVPAVNKRNSKAVTESEYEAVRKIISLAGEQASLKSIGAVVGRSYSTIKQIRDTKSYAEYVETSRASIQRLYDRRVAKQAQQEQLPVSETIADQPLPEDPGEPDDIPPPTPAQDEFNTRLLNALDRIGDSLDKLASAWESSPKKKGLF